MNAPEPKARMRKWLAEPLTRDLARSVERIAATEDVRYVALMPDVHLARDVCIGTVVATERLIFPAAVGGDIGCGMAAVLFDAEADLLAKQRAAARLLSGLYRSVPTMRHSAATMREKLPMDLDHSALSHPRLEKLKQRDGRVQFGTLGRGNHFLEFQADRQRRLWLMLHSGSRAMGQAITAHHLACAETTATGLAFLDAQSEQGQAYLADVAWALRYADQNRLAMIDAVVELVEDLFGISADRESLIHGHHNHVRRESHFGHDYWVHRKGAQSAQADEPGLIPGSMGTASFHVTGRGCEDAICSCSHGAGRKFSRSETKRKVSTRQLHREMESVWFDQRRADALRDEAPSGYKDIYSVMRAQKKLIRIVRELRPLLSYKGV